MGFTPLYKGRAQQRSKRLKGRKEWQDVLPTTPEGRTAYKIADKYQARFANAFLEATRNLLSDKDTKRNFKRAWKTGSIIEIMETLPLFREGISDVEDPVWSRFITRMNAAYKDVMQESGTAAMKDLNRALGTNLKFVVENEEPDAPDVVEKAKKKKPPRRVPVVPVNPYSVAWMKARSLELVTQGITPAQTKIVQDVLINGFEKGIRAEEAYETIRANIGLTEREYRAVENRRRALLQTDMPDAKIKDEVSKYQELLTKKRAQRIARTETIKANAQGRSDAWRVAQDEGSLSTNVRRMWLAPPPSPNPDRPCEICLELDTKTAPVGGMYESAFIGMIEGPTAHPNCLPGNTAVLAHGVTAVSKRWYEGDVFVLRTSGDKQITCTPNHPILTELGWVAAHLLDVGDDIVCNVRGQDIPPALVDHEHEDVPTVVDTISNLFDQLSFSQAVPVPGTPKDFHGDGRCGEVTVILTDGMLWNGFDASGDQQLAKLKFFVRRVCCLPLACLSPFKLFLHRRFSTAYRFMRRFCKSLALSGIRLRHSEIHGRTAVAGRDSGFEKEPTNDVTADAPGFAQRLLAKSGNVVLDNIVDVDVQSFAGHVYNLQTVGGYYIAQSIYTHNCRCTETLTRERG